MSISDPEPWVHVSGERAAHPHAPGAPQGGYTYLPRVGYTDHPDRYVKNRSHAIYRNGGRHVDQ